jgi:acetyl esterase
VIPGGDNGVVDVRKLGPVAVVVALALGVGVLAIALRGDGDSGSDDRAAPASTTASTTSVPTTSTTRPPATTSTTLPPAAAATAPPSTVTPGTVVVLPTLPPRTVPETTPTTTTVSPAPVERETVVYSPDGAPRRKGDLVVPEDHRSTAIVLVHGGGGTRGSRRDVRAWADAYADAGYVSFSIDYFLFNESTPPPVYPAPERDAKAAVQYLRQHGAELGVDPDRIVVQGFSSGAALAGALHVSGDDAFFAGEGRYDDGTSDTVNGLIGFYGTYGGERTERYYDGPPDSDDAEVQARYERNDSVSHAADASGPALLFHGDADDTLPLERSVAFSDALSAAGQDATLTVVEGAGHGFDRTRRRLTGEGRAAFDQVLAWLEERFPEASERVLLETRPQR